MGKGPKVWDEIKYLKSLTFYKKSQDMGKRSQDMGKISRPGSKDRSCNVWTFRYIS